MLGSSEDSVARVFSDFQKRPQLFAIHQHTLQQRYIKYVFVTLLCLEFLFSFVFCLGMLFTLVTVSLAAIVAASSSSSSTSASKHVGTKVSLSDVVQYGSSFYFWDKELKGTFQHASATCASLYVDDADSSEAGFVTKYKGWRICHDSELISINAYLQAQGAALDGLYFSGVTTSVQQQATYGHRRGYGTIDFVAFNNGVWQVTAGRRLARTIIDGHDDVDTGDIAYYGDILIENEDVQSDAKEADFVLNAYCCVGPQANGAGHDAFEFQPLVNDDENVIFVDDDDV